MSILCHIKCEFPHFSIHGISRTFGDSLTPLPRWITNEVITLLLILVLPIPTQKTKWWFLWSISLHKTIRPRRTAVRRTNSTCLQISNHAKKLKKLNWIILSSCPLHAWNCSILLSPVSFVKFARVLCRPLWLYPHSLGFPFLSLLYKCQRLVERCLIEHDEFENVHLFTSNKFLCSTSSSKLDLLTQKKLDVRFTCETVSLQWTSVFAQSLLVKTSNSFKTWINTYRHKQKTWSLCNAESAFNFLPFPSSINITHYRYNYVCRMLTTKYYRYSEGGRNNNVRNDIGVYRISLGKTW